MRRSSREQISRETPARSEGLVRSACEVELCWHHDARSKVLPTPSKELPACGEELFGSIFCHPERSEGSNVQAGGRRTYRERPASLVVAGFERSSYGRSTHSKNTHVRFHESICSGESTRSNVCGSTRRLNACPTDDPHGAGST